MAADSGQPQDTPKTKKAVTPEQRKRYTQFGVIGVIGVLALVAGVMYLPGLFKGDADDAASTVPATRPTAPTAARKASKAATTVATTGAGNKGIPGAVTPGTGAAAPTVTTSAATVAVVPVARFRPDPFQRVYFIPTPTPLPPPPTPIPGPVVIPPPVDLPSPAGVPPMSPIGLPSAGRGSNQASQRFNLPPVSINRLDEVARRPTDAFPPRRTAGTTGLAGGSAPSPSTDKRLSGVIISDGVRALLEIQGAQGVVTRVVQPGDEVEGITVLNIQRYNDGTRVVTRMLIRENGEERTVELRASSNPTTQVAPGG